MTTEAKPAIQFLEPGLDERYGFRVPEGLVYERLKRSIEEWAVPGGGPCLRADFKFTSSTCEEIEIGVVIKVSGLTDRIWAKVYVSSNLVQDTHVEPKAWLRMLDQLIDYRLDQLVESRHALPG